MKNRGFRARRKARGWSQFVSVSHVRYMPNKRGVIGFAEEGTVGSIWEFDWADEIKVTSHVE